MVSLFPSSVVTVISKDPVMCFRETVDIHLKQKLGNYLPLLMVWPSGLSSDVISSVEKGDEARTAIFSLARFLKVCQDLQWRMEI